MASVLPSSGGSGARHLAVLLGHMGKRTSGSPNDDIGRASVWGAHVTLDELMVLCRSEPTRVEEREVFMSDPALLKVLERRPLSLAEIISDPRKSTRRKTFRTGHVFGNPADPLALAAWERRWPRYALPSDLRELLLAVNGIHLGADLDTGRAYEGLSPFEEWAPARTKMWGPEAGVDALDEKYLAISYNMDHSDYVTLDVDSGRYFLMDACGADESCPIGNRVEDLLDWLWRSRLT